jgi:DNA-binding NtrC family response regulator
MNSRSTVLYVDDNPKARRLLSAVLQQNNFEVITAEGSTEAIALINNAWFDLALVDYGLPGMTGAQLAQEIRGHEPGMPIVLISGLKSIPKGELTYVDAYCGEGTTLDNLVETMHALVRSQGVPFGGAQSAYVDAT